MYIYTAKCLYCPHITHIKLPVLLCIAVTEGTVELLCPYVENDRLCHEKLSDYEIGMVLDEEMQERILVRCVHCAAQSKFTSSLILDDVRRNTKNWN